ncbi:hypothetical protein HK104_000960, partial [Borealophlyctis nickersoniae]
MFTITGPIIDAPSPGALRIRPTATISIDDTGRIVSLVDDTPIPTTTDDRTHILLGKNEFLIPGFIDTHIHAPQYTFTGSATSTPLLPWLERYAFPAEQRVSDPEYAKRVYGKLVCMDRNSPPTYTESTSHSLADTETFIHHIQSLNTPLIHPIITPRFVPTCTPTLLRGLADLSTPHTVRIQTHASESEDQIAFVKSLHPPGAEWGTGTDVEVLDRCGIVKSGTVLAHTTRLTEAEETIIRKRGAGIAHCPLSNVFFGDAVLGVRGLMRPKEVCGDAGTEFLPPVKIGLGTDVAGGYAPSMLTAMRAAVISSRVRVQHLMADAPPGPRRNLDEEVDFKF